MYTKYTYSAGSTNANILNDVILLLTGTTDKTLLSANCDQANTEILTTYEPAGWTLHDANSGTVGLTIISAPQSDFGTKYVGIYVGVSGPNLHIILNMYEDWNAATNVSVNAKYQSATYSQRLNTTSGGILYISASVRRIVLLSFQSGIYGSPSSDGWSFFGERTRDQNIVPYDTAANALPLAFFASPDSYLISSVQGDSISAISRVFNISTGAVVTSTNVVIFLPFKGYGVSNTMGPTSGRIQNPVGGQYIPIYRMFIGDLFTTAGVFEISSKTDIWCVNRGVGSILDEIVYEGKTRVLWHHNVLSQSAFGSIMVPKG